MRVSYNAVYKWLKSQADTCSLDQLHALDELIDAAKKIIREKQAHSQEALEAANDAAKAKGYASLDDLLRNASPELAVTYARVVARSGVQQRGATRKCFMDPMDPNTPLFAIFSNRVPEQLKKYLENPDPKKKWARHELHYEHIAASRIARGLSKSDDDPYDPLKRYDALAKEENAKPNRIRRVSRKTEIE